MLHQFDAICGNDRLSINKPLNSLLTKFLEPMDSTTIAPPYPVVMAQQIQALIANVQEFKKQNEDLKRRVCLDGTNTSQSQYNRNENDDKAHSPGISRRETSKHTTQLTHGNNQVMKKMRKELDEVKNAMKGKTTINLNGIIKRTGSPFTAGIFKFPLPPKFHLP